MPEKVQSLRARIDDLNLELLALLSERARLAGEVGKLQTAAGASQYDPVREQQMLDMLVAANRGPFDDATVKSLFKQVFQASMQLSQRQEKRQYLMSRARQPHDTVVRVGDLEVGSGRPPVLIAGPCAIESRDQVFAVEIGRAH